MTFPKTSSTITYLSGNPVQYVQDVDRDLRRIISSLNKVLTELSTAAVAEAILDGGVTNQTYLPGMVVDGGLPSTTYLATEIIDGGSV